jgi:peptide deformylase
MSELTIITYPHKILKTPALPVTRFDEDLRGTIQNMLALMYKEEGVGLAAPQVGLPWRLFVMDVSEELNAPLCFINPTIVDKQGECDSDEGCLSLPGLYVKVKRASSITVNYQDESGHPCSYAAEGLASRAIQHEIDHLNGIVFLDHLSKLKRMMAIKKLQKHQQTEE